MIGRYRRTVFALLEGWGRTDWLGRSVDIFLIVLITLNVLAVALSTETALFDAYRPVFLWFELFSVAVFTAEYGLRVWASVENPDHVSQPHWKARLRYISSPMAIVDLLAILPTYLMLIGLGGIDLRVLRAIRLIRILKLARYSPAIQTLSTVFYNERRTMGAVILIVFIMLIVSSSLIYLAESGAQPENFRSIPAAMWWAMATLTTVGYGDVVPVTVPGKIIGAFVMVTGIGIFVLWTGIFASSFAEELSKRKFQVSWTMVTQVPAFSGLSAVDIGEIAQMMRPLIVPPRYTITRYGEVGDSMFFVVSGEVEVEVYPQPVVLGPGSFFGEVALLHDTIRSATVVALTETRLMVLDADNFKKLLAKHETVRHAMEQSATARKNLLDNLPPPA